MTTKMTANGVSTTTTPGTEQYEVFTPATAHGVRNTINTITATPMENYSPAWLVHSKSADNAVMSG